MLLNTFKYKGKILKLPEGWGFYHNGDYVCLCFNKGFVESVEKSGKSGKITWNRMSAVIKHYSMK
jgi:hypothetical protein